MFNMEFLGTANASGIPVYNCQCEICKEYRQKEHLIIVPVHI